MLRLYVPIFSLTLLLSAALLFSVQPMFSKMVLPLLGGTPQVWNTAMLFFQCMLLAGYAYAHGTTKFLSVRVQSILHIILLALFFALLPIAIPDGNVPPVNSDPTFWQLSLMFGVVGGPFFALAATAPMLQRWFSRTDHPDADNPYFLYGASNLGSIGALIAYPFILEPLLSVSAQSEIWRWGYAALIAFTAISALIVFKKARGKESSNKQIQKNTQPSAIRWADRFRWLALAFIPSSLMLGVTSYITTDIASAPLLWIAPLALYVTTFIIVFARKQIVSANISANIFLAFLLVILVQFSTSNLSSFDPLFIIGIHFGCFFFAALMCHKELADRRPDARHLTEFYLIMSLGGALGGFLNAIVAPQIFTLSLEYGLVLGLACFVRFSGSPEQSLSTFISQVKTSLSNSQAMVKAKPEIIAFMAAIICALTLYFAAHKFILTVAIFIFIISVTYLISTRWPLAICTCLLLALFPSGHKINQLDLDVIHQERNFFGVIRVVNSADNKRFLMHGTTLHGEQSLGDDRLTPVSYYSDLGPLGDVMRRIAPPKNTQNIAAIGLGVGVVSCYQHPLRHYDFFEIDFNH